MNANIQALIKACKQNNIEYKFLHKDKLFVEITLNNHKYHFVYTAVPLNLHVHARIAEDKDYTYSILKDVIKMPKNLSYLDPNIEEKYKKYINFQSIAIIAKEIETKFDYPIIIKPNRLYGGTNVSLCKSKKEIKTALEKIFSKNEVYDYVALAQGYIKPVKEFRVIILNKKVELIYEKDISDAEFGGNLSPLHWEGAKAKEVKNEELKIKIQKFIEPMFDCIDIKYAGLDVILDENDELWLLEINNQPGFDIFAEHNGLERVVELYGKILEVLEVEQLYRSSFYEDQKSRYDEIKQKKLSN